MVLFLDVLEQGLTGKIDVSQKICEFLLVFASRAWNFNFTPLLGDMNFTKNWLCVTKRTNYVPCRRRNASCNAEPISYKLCFFLSFWRLLGNILHIYVLLYKTIAVGLLEYQSSGQNSIFTLSIFIKLSYNYSFVGKNIKLAGSHLSSYADAFRELNNT